MYLFPKEGRAWHATDGTQHAGRGWFLIMTQSDRANYRELGIRCFVRKVALEQVGHWMMGTARIYGHSVTISGAYGNDGLTKNVSHELFLEGYPLPDPLYKAWATDTAGWNSAGSEGPSIREWAVAHLHYLTPSGTVSKYEALYKRFVTMKIANTKQAWAYLDALNDFSWNSQWTQDAYLWLCDLTNKELLEFLAEYPTPPVDYWKDGIPDPSA